MSTEDVSNTRQQLLSNDCSHWHVTDRSTSKHKRNGKAQGAMLSHSRRYDEQTSWLFLRACK